MKAIDFGCEFALKNLETNEFFKFLMERYTVEYEPVYSIGTENRISYVTKSTSRGGNILPDGVRILTNEAPLGKLVFGKKEGDKILFRKDNNTEVNYLVVAVGKDRVAWYEKKLGSDVFEKAEKKSTVEKKDKKAYCKNGLIPLTMDIVGEEYETTKEIKPEYKRGLDLFVRARMEKRLPIIQANYWTADYCFVVENLETIGKVTYLVGTTLKNGKVYERNVKYVADKIFKEYALQEEMLNSIYSVLFNADYLFDPIELDPVFIRMLNEVDILVKNKIGFNSYKGYCYVYWETKKAILKEVYNIDWKSPSELNPGVSFE